MIKIAYNKRIDAVIISNAEKQFQSLGIKTESREQKDGISNSIWWALPPLIGFWIAKPFLDGFLSKLGKDSAGQFKKILREIYSKLRNSPIRAYDRSDFEKIESGASPMSVGHALPVIGIGLQIEDAVKRRWGIRCIFPAELSEYQIQKAIEQMQSYLPSVVELERKYLADLKENQIVLGSRSYIYDLQRGWISADKTPLQQNDKE
jgi:hypothetical protein